jgi:hypothetical protein
MPGLSIKVDVPAIDRKPRLLTSYRAGDVAGTQPTSS